MLRSGKVREPLKVSEETISIRSFDRGERLKSTRLPTNNDVLRLCSYYRYARRSEPNDEINLKVAKDVKNIYTKLGLETKRLSRIKEISDSMVGVIDLNCQDYETEESRENNNQDDEREESRENNNQSGTNDRLTPTSEYQNNVTNETEVLGDTAYLEYSTQTIGDESNDDYVLSQETFEKQYNTLNLDEVTAMAERFNIESSKSAAIGNAIIGTLCRQGFIDPSGFQDRTKVIPQHLLVDPKKINRARIKARTEANLSYFKNMGVVEGISVDGKFEHQATILKDGINQKCARELLTIVQLPQQSFMGCVTLTSKSSQTQCEALCTFFEKNKVPTKDLKLFSTDGENANVGQTGGLFYRFQRAIDKELHFLVCLLHWLQLMIHVAFDFCNVGGRSTSGKTFTGPIGSHLANVEDYHIESTFEKIECPIDLNAIPSGTSTDQHYLILIAKVISTGVIPPKFETLRIGELNQARWITLASRVLKLYLSKNKPSQMLTLLCKFIMQVYIPIWFSIKCKWQIYFAPLHIFDFIQRIQPFPQPLINKFKRSIEHNFHGIHPESILTAAAVHESYEVRKFAVEKIVSFRRCRANTESKIIRVLEKPEINFAAESFWELVSFNKANQCDPPLLRQFEDLNICLNNPEIVRQRLQFPCHTQRTEFYVQAVHKAVPLCNSDDQIMGMVRLTEQSRRVNPILKHKQQYQLCRESDESEGSSVDSSTRTIFPLKMAAKIPNVMLNNGNEIPILGLGTCNSEPGEVTQAVKDAIDAGYRHFDCANMYQNEKEVGKGINDKIAEGVIKREDIFVTSTLWNTCHNPVLVESACKASLENMNLEYIDLFLIQLPMDYTGAGSKVQYNDHEFVNTYNAMENLVDAGLIKSIGLSNFNSLQFDSVWKAARIKPVTNQVECHPYLNQNKLAEHHRKHNVPLTAYSPLGSPDRPLAKFNEPNLLDDSTVAEIATKYMKNATQILIRYQIQKGNIVIPTSITKSCIISNAEVFDFELSVEDIAKIDSFDCNECFV